MTQFNANAPDGSGTPPDQTPPSPGVPSQPDIARAAGLLKSRLESLRQRAWLMLVSQRVGLIIGWAVMALILGGLLDYFLRAPAWLRTAGLLGAIAALAWAIFAIIRPAVRFRPSLTELALRVEKADPGKQAGLSNLLAAGLELASREHSAGDRRIAGSVVMAAADRAGTVRLRSLLAPARTARSIVWFAAALGLFLGFAAVEPGLTRTGLARMLLPFSSAEWPKRTGIVDATEVRVHPLGTALALRAALTKHAGSPTGTRVEARFRVIADGKAGTEQRVLLTSQDRSVSVPQDNGPTLAGTLFERLIEPKALMPEKRAAGADVELEYTLVSEDDETSLARIRLVEPPAIVHAAAKITAPAYVAGADTGGPAMLDLGTGTDERAVPAPILGGSRVEMVLEFNKTLPAPPASPAVSGSGNPADAAKFHAWVQATLGTDTAKLLESPGAATLTVNGPRWTLDWTLTDPIRLSVRATDEHGIRGSEDAVFRLDALTDRPPTASVTAPTEDKSVLPTAQIDLAGEGRDDVGLSWVTLESQLARRPQGSEGGAPEAVAPPTELARQAGGPDAGAGVLKRLTVAYPLDLSTLGVKPGDEVWITALAADTFEIAGKRHDPVRSSVRRLRIMSREELVEQIWSELAGVRRAAIKIDQDQVQARQAAGRPGADAARQAERAQAGISERLSRQGDSLKHLQERLSENSLADAQLNQTVREAREMLARAGTQSAKGAGAMNTAAQKESAENAQPDAAKQERAEADQAQQGVRDELGNLIELLDQGEDTFATKRALERLLEQEKALRDRTNQAAKNTAGKPMNQLSDQERQSLEQIGQEQHAAADQLREAVRKTQEREQKLRKSDPAAADAMAQTAKRAERQQVAQKMEQAAQQAKQNQVGSAQQQQGAAIASLEQMLEDLDQAQGNRDEVLRRFLASLIESIGALIENQKAQLDLLRQRGADGAGLDGGMTSLHQNTLGVMDQAAEGPRELAPIVKVLGEAADAQAASVVSLRAAPIRDEEARGKEELSLEKLEAAKAQAEKLNQQAGDRQSGRKRAELRKKYEQLLSRQISIKDEAEGLSQAEVSRRTRAAARQLATEQTAVREELDQLKRDTKELADAPVFDFAHVRLSGLIADALTPLEAGESTPTVVRRQTSAVRVLTSLIESLQDPKKDDKNAFREAQGGGGGGGGGSPPPLIPPRAQVALLRSMQQEAIEMTRAAGDAGAKADPDSVAQATRLQHDLAEQGQELMERMARRQNGGGGPPAPKGGSQ